MIRPQKRAPIRIPPTTTPNNFHVTDINTIEFVPRGSKEGEQLADTKPEYQGLLNLTWEAKELGRIIQEGDKKAEGTLRELTTDVLTAMESMRKQNNIVFGSEK